ncbi:amino acid ABC transporter permease, partial [Brevibacterium sp. 50QC2O2]|uniref:amino acid ABC transporter permease n=1 Tax=Brevibacterium sp. 50QC2O2 TaxID=2968459 RepID=UPI00211B8BE3
PWNGPTTAATRAGTSHPHAKISYRTRHRSHGHEPTPPHEKSRLALINVLVFNEAWNWSLVGQYLFSKVIMLGVWHTIELTLCVTVLGIVLGIITAACRVSNLAVLRALAIAYIWVMRAMPPLVMLLLIFFLAALIPQLTIGIPFGPDFLGIPTNDVISRFSAGVIGLSIYMGAYVGEIIRGGIQAVPEGQFEACRSLALTNRTTYFKVIGPQVVRTIIPSLANEVITTFKSTSLVSVIGFTELHTTVQNIYAVNFETIPLLTVAVIWYLVLTSIAMMGQSALERRFGRGFNKRVITTKRTTSK